MTAATLAGLLLLAATPAGGDPAPLVPRVRALVQPEIDKHLADAQAATMAELAIADTIPALFKPPLRQRAVADPWGACGELERRGLDLAAAARGGLAGLPGVVARLGGFLDKPAATAVAVPRGRLAPLDDHLRYITAVLDAAARLRDEAVAGLPADARRFLFERPATLVREFSPQVRLGEATLPRLQDDRAFCTHWERMVDGPKFAAAVQTLLQLTDPAYLDELRAVMAAAAPLAGGGPPGVGGDVLAVRDTRHGLVVLAGRGRNEYRLTRPVAFLADLGGDDVYRGTVAASFDADHPFGVVVDFAGDDVYEPAPLGLATGRLGCGCLVDRGGDDRYTLAPGCGGCGFGGVGVLVDEAGRDTYAGSRFTQGAAVAGTGLLLDLAGDDTYTADEYALAVGGPAGVGAVVDVAGNDRYRCGFKTGSGYNSSDAPTARPGDPSYQYDAFGLGIGVGRRTYPPTAESGEYHLAGGVGVWLDLAGDDAAESSNFSQACAYFFGIGLKLDLAGNDRHAAARYGAAAGAHYGMGLFLDYAGDDSYPQLGPVYTLGCAWDRSVFLLADGAGDDTYDLTRSTGCGRGDRGGWGVFADLAGRDRYRGVGAPGGAADKGLGVFFDGGGEDEYPPPAGPSAPANRTTRRNPVGGLFIDH